jgi:alpha/beta superfamily hydrolase
MERVTFRTDDGLTLEGELWAPDAAALGPAVLCHPHPRHGGSKDHPLLWSIRIELVRRGFAVLSFNFRGVMGSEGRYGGGEEEPADVRAAVTRAGEAVDGPTFVCGWSFGANVALRTALDDQRIEALALVGVPLSDASPEVPPLPDAGGLASFARPVLLLAGDADPFCPPHALLELAGALANPTVTIVEGANHFFSKREREAAEIVGRFAETTLFSQEG